MTSEPLYTLEAIIFNSSLTKDHTFAMFAVSSYMNKCLTVVTKVSWSFWYVGFEWRRLFSINTSCRQYIFGTVDCNTVKSKNNLEDINIYRYMIL